MSDAARGEDGHDGVLAIHLGHSANCSSVGSVVDLLFVSVVVGTATLAALAILVRAQPKNDEAGDGASPKRGSDGPPHENSGGTDAGPR